MEYLVLSFVEIRNFYLKRERKLAVGMLFLKSKKRNNVEITFFNVPNSVQGSSSNFTKLFSVQIDKMT
jgi:hypothetical protein